MDENDGTLKDEFRQLLKAVEGLREDLRERSSGVASEKVHFTRHEAAGYLCISVRKLDDFVSSGKLRRVKLGSAETATVLFRRRDLDEFIERHLEMSDEAVGRHAGEIRL